MTADLNCFLAIPPRVRRASGFWAGCLGLLAIAASAHAQDAFRGVWAEVFRPGYTSTFEVDQMVDYAAAGNYNVILPELLAYQDRNGYPAHGAFWNSNIVPEAPCVTGGFDPLAYLCQQAHVHGPSGIEVHVWIVPFRVSLSWPPASNATLTAHPEWLMVPQANMGGGPAAIDGAYTLDPGSPDVQDHVVSIVRELVNNYPIDGINFDHIRYEQADAGYPTSTSYTRSGLARFRQITGYVGTPSPSDSAWCDFRRRTIDELVRRCRAEIAAIKSHPRQPIRFSADLICFGDAPGSFTSSSAYGLFQNWRLWMEQGWLDAGLIMNYKFEHCPPQNTWYRNWVSSAVAWSYQRHIVIGQANYLNSKSNSIVQMRYANDHGAEGTANYNYYQTAISSLVCSGYSSLSDMTWYNDVKTNLFVSPVATPKMVWRDPATATEGTLWGRVTNASTGQPVDDATVQVAGRTAVKTDGSGYFAVTMIPASRTGTYYATTVSKTGLPSTTHPAAIIFSGDIVRYDFPLGAGPPTIAVDPLAVSRSVVRGNNLTDDSFTVHNDGQGSLNYTITVDAVWLTVSPNQGTSTGELDTIAIRYSTAGLAVSDYEATITVKDAAATNVAQPITVSLSVIYGPVPGDFDGDRDVDQADFGVFQGCLTGPGVAQNETACQSARLDGDHDVDGDDLVIFRGCMSGANIPADPACAD